jgi:hypothetical protein
MSMPTPEVSPPTLLSTIVSAIANSNVVDLLTSALRLGYSIVRARMHEGMFDILEHEIMLEVLDSRGKTAIYRRRQKVRFLQDNIIAFQDQAWGDGNIFADYKCSPGIAVDRYREGYLYRILISLRGTRHRNDVEEFRIERKIEDGFIEDVETFQTDITARTKYLSLNLIFPSNRPPKNVTLIERNTGKAAKLSSSNFEVLPDRRIQVSWSVHKPHLFEAYVLRWEW